MHVPWCYFSVHYTGTPKPGGCKVVLKSMGGEEVQEHPGSLWFPTQPLLLSTYVDDLTLSGPQEEHQAVWSQLTSLVQSQSTGF